MANERGLDPAEGLRLPDDPYEAVIGEVVSGFLEDVERGGAVPPGPTSPGGGYQFGIKARTLSLSRAALDAGDPGTAFARLVVAVDHGSDRCLRLSRVLFALLADRRVARAGKARPALAAAYLLGRVAGFLADRIVAMACGSFPYVVAAAAGALGAMLWGKSL